VNEGGVAHGPTGREVVVWATGVPAGGVGREPARDAAAALVARRAPDATLRHRAGRSPAVDGAALSVSLTHAPGLALVAVTDGSDVGVGVDVELVRPAPAATIAQALLSSTEADTLERLAAPERDRAFARAWVRKEAVLKALGTGLAVDSRLVEVGAGDEAARVAATPLGAVAVTDVDLGSIGHAGHVGAVAVVGTQVPRVALEDAPRPAAG
jgi:4'-phosphopantetheinyl transferase